MTPLTGSTSVVVLVLGGGLLPATAALLALSPMTYFPEVASDPLQIAATHLPAAVCLGDIRVLNKDVLGDIVKMHPGSFIWLTGGLPCNDVHEGSYLAGADILKILQSLTNNLAFTFKCRRGSPSCRKSTQRRSRSSQWR